MTKEEAIKIIGSLFLVAEVLKVDKEKRIEIKDALNMAIKALQEPEQKTGEWIPFTSRSLTEEEKEIYPEWDGIYTCDTPKVGQEVLISYRKDVWTDTFFDDYGCGLENYGDIQEGMAWQPLPEPYKCGDTE